MVSRYVTQQQLYLSLYRVHLKDYYLLRTKKGAKRLLTTLYISHEQFLASVTHSQQVGWGEEVLSPQG